VRILDVIPVDTASRPEQSEHQISIDNAHSRYLEGALVLLAVHHLLALMMSMLMSMLMLMLMLMKMLCEVVGQSFRSPFYGQTSCVCACKNGAF
jgi:hypothetical protein